VPLEYYNHCKKASRQAHSVLNMRVQWRGMLFIACQELKRNKADSDDRYLGRLLKSTLKQSKISN
jgi:hypothetical protein